MKRITLVGLVVRYLRTNRKVAKTTFITGTYLVASTLTIVETGHVLEGVLVGLVAGTVKIGWHVAHSKIFNVAH